MFSLNASISSLSVFVLTGLSWWISVCKCIHLLPSRIPRKIMFLLVTMLLKDQWFKLQLDDNIMLSA